MSPEIRAREGLFLAFQYPWSCPESTTRLFFVTALNEARKYKNQPEIGAGQFLSLLKKRMQLVEMTELC